MSATYFWYQDKLVILHRQLLTGDFQQSSMLKFLYCPCVDTFTDTTFERYGIFVSTEDFRKMWEHRPLDSFPAEFRAHLLLLGVS